MLARTSRRTLHWDQYKQPPSGLELLNLPFLCPALFDRSKAARKDLRTLRNASSNSHPERPYIRCSRNHVSRTPSNRRRLASAATAVQFNPEYEFDTYIPWADTSAVTDFNRQSRFNGTGISNLRHFDPSSSPLIIKDTIKTHPKKFRVKDSITGDLNELHQNLHACLQVGRLERAAALMRRLNQIYNPDAPGLLAAHSDYVRELTNKIVQTQDQRLLKDLQTWFEVDLKHVGVVPNAEIYAQMIRASSQSSYASKERAMRRYQKIADDAGLGAETRALWEYDIEDSTPVCRSILSKLLANSGCRPLLRSYTR